MYYEQALEKFRSMELASQESMAYYANGREKGGGRSGVESRIYIKIGSVGDNPDMRKRAIEFDENGYYLRAYRCVGDVKLWEKNFAEEVSNPEKLREIVRHNIQHNKLEKIPYQDIAGVNYKEQ